MREERERGCGAENKEEGRKGRKEDKICWRWKEGEEEVWRKGRRNKR